MDFCDLWQGLFTETQRRLEQFQRRVREGVGVEEAQDFARYVRVSNLARLMTQYPPENTALARYFDYNGADLLKQARELETACCEYYKGMTRDSEGTGSGANKSDLEAIDEKLAGLMAAVAGLQAAERGKAVKPALRVVKGKVAA